MANIDLKPKNGIIDLAFILKYKGKPINQPDDRRKDDKHKEEPKESVHGDG